MNYLKRIVFTLASFVLLLLLTSPLNAQKIQTSIHGGLTISNMTLDIDGTQDPESVPAFDFDSVAGFQFGVRFLKPIADSWSLETGLQLNSRGYSNDYALVISGEEVFRSKTSLRLYYLELPLLMNVYIPIGTRTVELSGGPYLAGGVSGRYTSEIKVNENSSFGEFLELESSRESGNINWGSNEDEFPRIDYGVLFGAGVAFKSYTFRIYYQRGLSNFLRNNSPGDDGETITSNHYQTSFTVGYRF